MTKKGKGITLLLVIRETPIYVDLYPPQSGRPTNKKNAQLFFTSERALSARVSHIIRVKSKSIPYHAFSLSFSLALFLPTRQGEREQSVSTWNQASSQELTAWNPLPDYLPGIALEYSSSTSYASREDTTSA
ncbi:hypothetical protein FF2_012400 [Malus domestica]